MGVLITLLLRAADAAELVPCVSDAGLRLELDALAEHLRAQARSLEKRVAVPV